MDKICAKYLFIVISDVFISNRITHKTCARCYSIAFDDDPVRRVRYLIFCNNGSVNFHNVLVRSNPRKVLQNVGKIIQHSRISKKSPFQMKRA
jgi:hypothetical protein